MKDMIRLHSPLLADYVATRNTPIDIKNLPPEDIADILRKQIGHRIKVRRVELGLGQFELAERLGVPQSQISLWEIGRRGLRIDQAIALAAALSTSVGYLVGETRCPRYQIKD